MTASILCELSIVEYQVSKTIMARDGVLDILVFVLKVSSTSLITWASLNATSGMSSTFPPLRLTSPSVIERGCVASTSLSRYAPTISRWCDVLLS